MARKRFKPRSSQPKKQGGANSAHLLAGASAGYVVGRAAGRKAASVVSRKRVANRAAKLAKQNWIASGGPAHSGTTYNAEISKAIKTINRSEYAGMKRIPQEKFDLYKKLVTEGGSTKKAIAQSRKIAGISKKDIGIVREKRGYKALGNDLYNLKNAGQMASKRIAGKYGRRGGAAGAVAGLVATWLIGEAMKKNKR